MAITREEMLERLKALPEARFEEIVFVTRLDAIAPGKSTDRIQRAIEVIRATESRGTEIWANLERLVTEGVQTGGALAGFPRVAPQRLRHGAERLFGRVDELRRLDEAWSAEGQGKRNVMVIVAFGGVGKTSLVMEWMNRLAARGWDGAKRVFEWTFYSQGVRGRGSASGDTFVREGLRFFGDPDMAESAKSPWEKGARLAQLVAQQRALLVLDGLESLQHPPGRGLNAGELKDPEVQILLKGLARHNPGLCLVTTRETVSDLAPFHATSVDEWDLEHLSEEAGSALLKSRLEPERPPRCHVVASTEEQRREISRAVRGHALTLDLLGRYVHKVLGLVQRWREVNFEEADAEVEGGHAFKVMAAYEEWLGNACESASPPDSGRPNSEIPRQPTPHLGVLRLLGLFDRPADPSCLAALCKTPVVPGLNEGLSDLSPNAWNGVVSDLEYLGLVTTVPYTPVRVKGYSKELAGQMLQGKTLCRDLPRPSQFDPPPFNSPCTLPFSVDCHPLVREYFAKRLQSDGASAWQEGHRRIYEYLTSSVPYWPEGLDGLQPLYQAVAHGCLAGLHQQALDDTYERRILRGTREGGFYSWKKLGAVGADLGALASFFETRWTSVSPNLVLANPDWLLSEAALRLRALGRLTEAAEPMRSVVKVAVAEKRWSNAAISASNLSEVELTRGEVAAAVAAAEESTRYADRTKNAFYRMATRAILANAQYQAGRRKGAQRLFEESESLQAERQPEYPRLYSLPGFLYCDLLLSDAELAAWRAMGRLVPDGPVHHGGCPGETCDLRATCASLSQRATTALMWAGRSRASLLTIALHHLTSACAALFRELLDPEGTHPLLCHLQNPISEIQRHLAAAVDGLRASVAMHHLPRGLLTRAWVRFLAGDVEGSQADLDEAWEIAERGPMRLYQTDVLLYRARLFWAVTPYPWPEGPRGDLAAAGRLIEKHGYHRRDGELADARSLLGP